MHIASQNSHTLLPLIAISWQLNALINKRTHTRHQAMDACISSCICFSPSTEKKPTNTLMVITTPLICRNEGAIQKTLKACNQLLNNEFSVERDLLRTSAALQLDLWVTGDLPASNIGQCKLCSYLISWYLYLTWAWCTSRFVLKWTTYARLCANWNWTEDIKESMIVKKTWICLSRFAITNGSLF
jgi:hypothetical protein